MGDPKKSRSDLKKTGVMPRIEAEEEFQEKPPMPPDLPEFPPDDMSITGVLRVQQEGEDTEKQNDVSAIDSHDESHHAAK